MLGKFSRASLQSLQVLPREVGRIMGGYGMAAFGPDNRRTEGLRSRQHSRAAP
jgi:hypothetical protein